MPAPEAPTPPQPLYVLEPGWVRSRTDGDRHYIGAAQLAALYGVPLRRCLVLTHLGARLPEGAILLTPRSDGDYRLPEQ